MGMHGLTGGEMDREQANLVIGLLQRIADALEMRNERDAPKPGCIMHDTDDECRRDAKNCKL